MSNPSKRKGTWFESLICDHLVENWDDRIVRVAQAGANDQGDIANFRFHNQKIAVECKNVVSLSGLGGWLLEAQREATNIGARASIVVHKRKGKGAAQDQYVTTTLKDFLTILRMSEHRGIVRGLSSERR